MTRPFPKGICCEGGDHPTNRGPRALRCLPHHLDKKHEQQRRYQHSEAGRARRRAYAVTPKEKIRRAAYADAHPDQMKVYGARYRAKKSTVGTWIKCIHPDCTDGFFRTEHNGGQKYCKRDARESIEFSNALSHAKYLRRKERERQIAAFGKAARASRIRSSTPPAKLPTTSGTTATEATAAP